MTRYPNIGDHGLIGDLQTAALVSTDGVLDWFCCPRFDSPSVFASLLDADRGGFYRIAPDRDDYVSKQLYLPDSAILVTRFMTPDGVGEVHDFMPVIEGPATDRHRLVRNIRVVRGVMRFAVEIQPRFDYGRKPHTLEISDHGAVFRSEGMELALHGIAPEGSSLAESGITPERAGDGLRWTRTLREGEIGGVVLESMGGTPRTDHARGSPADGGRHSAVLARLAAPVELHRPVAGDGRPVGHHAEADDLYADRRAGRGADHRAARAGRRGAQLGLPLHLDPGRLVLHLRAAGPGLRGGGGRVRRLAAGPGRKRQAGQDSGPLKIMYRVDGSSDLVEESLDHFEGWRGSRPVRIGNGAADQLQLDIYGEAADAIYLADSRGVQAGSPGLDGAGRRHRLVVRALGSARRGHLGDPRRPEELHLRPVPGLAGAGPRDPAGDPARPAGRHRPLDRQRDAVYRQIMERGWNPKIGAFTQHYDTEVLDSSLLLMPLQGFIAPRDPMWLSTLDAMDRELVSDSLVYRYNPSASPDGLAGDEGTFSLCTFWYVDALARAGRLEEARLVFEKMHTYANHLGLYSEEIGSTGEQLGNFPQAFSHLSLISAAINLDRQLDERA